MGPHRRRTLGLGRLFLPRRIAPLRRGVACPDWPYGGAVAHFSNEQGDYSDHGATFEHPEAWEWSHGLVEVVSALAGAGLHLEFLDEHPLLTRDLGDVTRVLKRAEGAFEVPGSTLPLSFSRKALRP